jgi:hypothetical protein
VNVNQGQFLDSPVEGLSFISGGESGVTDAAGMFTFEEGATVEFSIGGIVVGEATAQSIMTPVDLVPGARGETNPTVINISRFLQTLDNDNNPGNGITITGSVRTQAAGASIDFDQDVIAFENDSNVQAVVAELTALTDAGARPLTSSQEAQDHLRNTLLERLAGTYSGTFSGDDSGTWTVDVDVTGNIIGSGVSREAGPFEIFGAVTSSGEATFAAGGVTTGATFSGTLSFSGEASGTWVNEFAGESGTFSGSKLPS